MPLLEPYVVLSSGHFFEGENVTLAPLCPKKQQATDFYDFYICFSRFAFFRMALTDVK